MRASIIVAIGLGMLLSSPSLMAQWGEEETSLLVPLEKILKHPQAFQGIEVSTIIQFHSVGNFDNPVYTRYEKEWYLNFSGWPDGARLWERSAYMDDFPFFFVKRRSDPSQAMLEATMFSRWIVTGKVTRIWKNMPWFDVVGLRRLDTQLDETSLRYLVDGFAYHASGRYPEAAAAFRATDHAALPTPIRVMAIREEAVALNAVGRTPEAVQRLEAGLGLLPGDPALTTLLVEYRYALGLDADGNPLPVVQPVMAPTTASPEFAPAPPQPAVMTPAQPVYHEQAQPVSTPPAQPYGHEVVQPTPPQPAAPYHHEVVQPTPPQPAAPYHHELVQPTPEPPVVTPPVRPAEVTPQPMAPTQPQPTSQPATPTRPAVPKVSLEVVPPEKKDAEKK